MIQVYSNKFGKEASDIVLRIILSKDNDAHEKMSEKKMLRKIYFDQPTDYTSVSNTCIFISPRTGSTKH